MSSLSIREFGLLGLALTIGACADIDDRDHRDEGGVPDAPGAYPVGFTHFGFDDPARGPLLNLPGLANARHLIVEVWYPSVRDPDAAPARYDYADSLEQNPTIDAALAVLTDPIAMTDQRVGFASIVDARIDARVAGGRFPLVVFSHGGGGSPFDQVDTMERLASHGFVVASINHRNADRAALLIYGHPELFAFDPAVIADPVEQQRYVVNDRLRDITATIDAFAGSDRVRGSAPTPLLDHVDTNAVAVTGWSYGACASAGIAAGVAADGIAADPRVRAIAPLEMCGAGQDAEGFWTSADWLTDDDLGHIHVPMLAINASLSGGLAPQRVTVQAASATRIEVWVADAVHASFGTVDDCRLQASLLTAHRAGAPMSTYDRFILAAGFDNQFAVAQGNPAAASLASVFCPRSIYPSNWDTEIAPSLVSALYEIEDTQLRFYGFDPDLQDYSIQPSPGWLDAVETARITSSLLVSFLRVELAGDDSYAQYLTPEYAAEHEPRVQFTFDEREGTLARSR